MLLPIRSLLTGFCLLALCSPVHAQTYLDLNFGAAPSKSVLGLSYGSGRNELNLGLKGFWIGTNGYEFSPGISYNRTLTGNGFYAGAGYALHLYSTDRSDLEFTGPDSSDFVRKTYSVKEWDVGNAFFSLGKTFRFTRWGIHADATLGTPVTREFLEDWFWWVGVGLSYRFRSD